MEGLITDIYKQNLEILQKMSSLEEMKEKVSKLEEIIINQDLNRKQAADFLKVSTKTIERATLAGKLDYSLIGKNYYYSKKSLLEFKERKSFKR